MKENLKQYLKQYPMYGHGQFMDPAQNDRKECFN
jgi:hypothetical protein